MAFNLKDIYCEIDKLLSKNPNLQLYEFEIYLGCSHPTIRKAIYKHRFLGYREYRNRKLLEKRAALSSEGYSVKEIAWELGYKWPENFTRFSRKAAQCSASKIKTNPEYILAAHPMEIKK
jgi:AraC-like DNA-binding protein